jgi:hypothetical protein
VRYLFTTSEARARGLTRSALRHGERRGRWTRITTSVYGAGGEPPSALDRARAAVLARPAVATGRLAAVLLGLDGVALHGPEMAVSPTASGRGTGVRRRAIDPAPVVVVHQVPCTDGLQTLVDLATNVDDAVWEQALESALRKKLVTIEDLEPHRTRTASGRRIARVLRLRPPAARPTESLLETLFVQLARRVPGLPAPERQVEVFHDHGPLVARVDLAWPDLGLFIELDGQHHLDQPTYDASRETAVVAVTGWLCGRFTWTEVTRASRSTSRRLGALVDQARRRPLADTG